jgi:hypothetical protein
VAQTLDVDASGGQAVLELGLVQAVIATVVDGTFI